MARLAREGTDAIYAAAGRFVEEALARDGSLFTPESPVWTTEWIDDLYTRFVEHPDTSSRSFMEKFRDQLDGAPDETLQLAAEILFIHFLISLRVGGVRKRELINDVLSWRKNSLEMPSSLDKALDYGLVGTGASFNTHRPFHVQFILEFTRRWKQMPNEERVRLLRDPWAFKEKVLSVTVPAAFVQREALLHLVFPDTFESIISREHKDRIATRFADYVESETDDVDHKLAEIRQNLSEELKVEFLDFYDSEIQEMWLPDSSRWGQFIAWARKFYQYEKFDEWERGYKIEIGEHLAELRNAVFEESEEWHDLFRHAVRDNESLLPWQLADTFVKWTDNNKEGCLSALRSLWDSEASVEDRVRHFLNQVPLEAVRGPGSRTALASYLHMAEGAEDYPIYRVTPFEKAFELTGHRKPPAGSDEAETYDHALEFLDRLIKEASSRGLELRDRLDTQGIVYLIAKIKPESLTSVLPADDGAAFLKYRGDTGIYEPEPEEPDTDVREPTDRLEVLAHDLLLDAESLQDIHQLLETKRQVIFHGPPGTGKTYVARKLADHLASRDSEVTLVQFHPSYSYEDFVEGFRPNIERAQGFRLVEGPLKRAARRAVENPGSPHFLIVDEINRGNLAKVFGELYFLLEYREQDITLQYSEEMFSLPDNLWFIGTMNTADRSIALVDSALRRRFHFVGFFPDEPPIEGLLRRWLGRNKPDLLWVADVVDRANELLGNRHMAIGPSHFLRDDLSESWIEVIWKHSVIPYLAEQFFGEEERLKAFALPALMKTAAGVVGEGEPISLDVDETEAAAHEQSAAEAGNRAEPA